MTGFQTLRPSKPLDIDYRGDAETEFVIKQQKFVKPFPSKD